MSIQVDAVYENKAKTIIDVETTDSFRTGSVAKSVLEKVLPGLPLPLAFYILFQDLSGIL